MSRNLEEVTRAANERFETFTRAAEGSLYLLPHLGKDHFILKLGIKIDAFLNNGDGGCGEYLARISARTGVDFDNIINPETNLEELFSSYFRKIGV